jgi:GTP 3',8-cyclase
MGDGIRVERPGLLDSFGRAATDLRVSVTDGCNFRCSELGQCR